MDKTSEKKLNSARLLIMLIGIIINVGMAYAAKGFGLPFSLDSAGTIIVAVECGLIPGIITALVTAAITGIFIENSIYYAIVNILIAALSARMIYNHVLKRRSGYLIFILVLGLVGGIGHSIVEIVLGGSAGLSSAAYYLLHDTAYSLIEKLIECIVAFIVIRLIPSSVEESIEAYYIKHRKEEIELDLFGSEEVKNERRQRHTRLLIMLMILAVSMTVVVAWISVSLYESETRKQRAITVEGVAKITANIVDGDRVKDFVKNGYDAEGYQETFDRIKNIAENENFIQYVYVYQIKTDGCHLVFDPDPEVDQSTAPGSLIEFDESFKDYLPALYSGERIPIIESDDQYGWLLTAYEPIYNSIGECVAYAGADVALDDVRDYITNVTGRIILGSSGFLFLAMAIGAWMSSNYHRADELELVLSKRKQDKMLLREIVEAFAKIIDMKDKYTNGHSSRVATYTAMLAKELGCDDETIEKYYNIALMHDVGKIGIPEDVLNKPGKLDPDEYRLIQSHSALGYNALKDISLMPELATGAGAHHERPDGKGYPNHLKQDEIPRVAQIIAVADTFDAMYSDRPYRNGMDFEKCVSIIKEVRGTQLTPDVVDAFLRLVDKGEFREYPRENIIAHLHDNDK